MRETMISGGLRPAIRRALGALSALILLVAPTAASASPFDSNVDGSNRLTAQVARSSSNVTDFEIRIVKGSNINLVATASRVPVQIRNDYDSDIRVLVWSRPSNLRVTMPKTVAFTAPANTTSNVMIPVEAIANGEVRLNVWLTSFSGVPLGHPAVLNMTVQREVEGSLLVGFAALVIGLGVVGARRMIKRRKVDE